MTDDIVTRLRDVTCGSERWCGNDPNCRPCDAIDEIEYLRGELANANSEYNKLWSKYNSSMRDVIHSLDKNYTEFQPYSRTDRDRWKEVAESLARQLGKVEYAYSEYEDRL